MTSVLVVDDDLLYRGLIVEALRLEGNTVLEAHSPESALRLLNKHANIDVVLCDLQMDGLNGLELIRTLHTQYCHPAVVVVSAHSADSAIGESARRYATEYLTKPFSIVKLLNTIRNVAQKSARQA